MGRKFLVYAIIAFAAVCVVLGPAVNSFGVHGGIVAVCCLALLMAWVMFFRKSLLAVLVVGALLFYFWRPFSGTAATQSASSCPAATRTSAALRGPYSSIAQLMRCDGVGLYALQLTGSGTAEYGFVILRDRRQATGGYYATPPLHSSQPANPACQQRPTVQPQDFAASWSSWISAAHANVNDYPVAATVHTHPQCPMASNSFTATDFDQAIAMKQAPATAAGFEEIVMINANDRKVRTFSPRDGDQRFTASDIETSDRFLPYLDPPWDKDALRVQILETYQ